MNMKSRDLFWFLFLCLASLGSRSAYSCLWCPCCLCSPWLPLLKGKVLTSDLWSLAASPCTWDPPLPLSCRAVQPGETRQAAATNST